MGECSGSRFKPLDKPIEEYITDQENKNTRAKTQRDVKLLAAFLLEKNEQRKIEEIQPEELNRYVSEFILSVKRKDGQDYRTIKPSRVVFKFQPVFKRTQILSEYYRRHCV